MLIEINPLTLPPSLFYTVIDKLDEKTDFFDYNTVEDFLSDIINGVYSVWINDHIIVLGEYRLYNTGLSVMNLTVVNYADSEYPFDDFRNDLKQLEDSFEEVDRIILEGRMGWKKVFTDYKHSSLVLYKDL